MTPELLAEALPKASYAVSRILRDYPQDVEDVLQQACLQAHIHQDTFKGESQFSTWFVKIAINKALMYVRHRKPRKFAFTSIDDVVLASRRQSPEEQAIRAQRRKLLARMIRRLTPIRRRELLLVITEERGDRRGNSQRKAAFHQAKIQLRKMLQLPPLPDKDRRQIIDLMVEIGEPVGHGLLMRKPKPKEDQNEKQLN
jgi:RNA polymerase sigma-70 factor (ECF subfamily)